MASKPEFPPDSPNHERALSDSELRAHVRDYFAMLEGELRGRGGRRRSFARTSADGEAAERIHRRIAAVLVEHGLPFLGRYKPLPSEAPEVRAAVAFYLRNHPELLRLMEADVDEPASMVPDLDGRSLDEVAVRAPEPGEIPALAVGTRPPVVLSGIDFFAREQRNASLAWAGELFVVRYEIARLREAGAGMYADYIEHVSAEEGAGGGFDIHSYDADGRDRYIKVKTSRYRRETPFYITANEIAMAAEHREHYWLYRVFDWRGDPRLYSVNGPLHDRFRLDPVAYRAIPR